MSVSIRACAAAIAACVWAGAPAAVMSQRAPAPWNPDLGGRYQNPVIFADYSDPDVVRAGSDFYLVASSFNVVPALPILHSRDLVNWTIVGLASPRRATTCRSTGWASGRQA